MNIRPCVEIQENYNEISTLCKETQEPVFLTKDGSRDLVVLDLETYETMRAAIDLREKLDEVLERRKKGMKGISSAQVIEHMRSAGQETAHV